MKASNRVCLTFKSPSGDSLSVTVDRLVLNEHKCSQRVTTYYFMAMG